MPRLYNQVFAVGACAYNAQTRRPTKWHPSPVKDAEGFCRRALDEAFDSWGMFLRPDYYDDSLQDLIIVLHRLERRFDPERTASFEQYARWIIPQRAVDVGPRRVLGRNGTRVHDYIFDDLPSESSRSGGSGGSFPEEPGDQNAACGRDERWLQPDYARSRARALAVLGLSPVGGAA